MTRHHRVLTAAARAIGAPGLQLVEVIREGTRADVLRAAEGDRTVVIKAHHDPNGTWRHEAAGLDTAHGLGSPELLGVSHDLPVLVMRDLGGGESLADRLLGKDPQAAEEGLLGWARGLADLHAGTSGRYDVHTARLAQLGSTTGLPEHLSLHRGLAEVDRLTLEHGLPRMATLHEAWTGLTAPLQQPEHWVLSPGDACPDNNLITSAGVRLLDFEFAEFRHPAWDVAYLRVPWPSCWCAWALPVPIADRGCATYRGAVSSALPWVGGPEFDDALGRATLAFCLATAGWFLGNALAGGQAGGDDGTEHRPGRRTMILSRLAVAATSPADDELAAYAGALAAALTRRWGAHPLAMAPAFA
ncbi:phosphotransferase family protein [Nocardioides limicola]|uniref:phosphotransferase family protein n=1 Tax=Nocardioides limicola TaxID=2803368 RepID=UPI00193B8330|nr:phosphotransferase [Nocardioides sp. DJM-14]